MHKKLKELKELKKKKLTYLRNEEVESMLPLSLLKVDCFFFPETIADPPAEHHLFLCDLPIELCPKPSDHPDDEEQGVKFTSGAACFCLTSFVILTYLTAGYWQLFKV